MVVFEPGKIIKRVELSMMIICPGSISGSPFHSLISARRKPSLRVSTFVGLELPAALLCEAFIPVAHRMSRPVLGKLQVPLKRHRDYIMRKEDFMGFTEEKTWDLRALVVFIVLVSL